MTNTCKGKKKKPSTSSTICYTTLNFGLSASLGTGTTMTTSFAVERRLNWLFACLEQNRAGMWVIDKYSSIEENNDQHWNNLDFRDTWWENSARQENSHTSSYFNQVFNATMRMSLNKGLNPNKWFNVLEWKNQKVINTRGFTSRIC